MKHFLLTFYADIPGKAKFKRYTKRVIEASNENEANRLANEIIKKEGVRFEPYYVKAIPPDQVALVHKQIKDTRKLRYQSNPY